MDEYTAGAFANRDEPIPAFALTASDDGSVSEPERPGKRDRLRQSASRVKAIAQELGAEQAQKLQTSGTTSLQDRLFAKLLQQVIPPEDIDSGPETPIDPRSSKYVQRPAFSLPLMTYNFRRFNARRTGLAHEIYFSIEAPPNTGRMMASSPKMKYSGGMPDQTGDPNIFPKAYVLRRPFSACLENGPCFVSLKKSLEDLMECFVVEFVPQLTLCSIGIVFVFQNHLIRLFSWKKPTHTLSFLGVYIFVCLNPYLLVVLPLAVLLLSIMIPAFVARHPPPPPSSSTSSTTPYYSYQGPAMAPPTTIRPAAETSKDFFRNMRDLQNSMADFSLIHDVVVKTVAPLTNFSNEILSSTIFLYLTFLTTSLFIIAQLIPWRAIFLFGGTSLIISGHPTVQTWLAKQKILAETSNDPSSTTQPNSINIPLLKLPLPTSPSAAGTVLTTLSAITLDSAPETREVEIFELQHRPLHSTTAEWEPHLFTPSPYDPLSPARISGDRPHGTRFFEDVQPPRGWTWEGPKWELDLEPREWIAERLITGVEFDVTGIGEANDDADVFSLSSHRGEFGGWVWDLPPALRSPGIEEHEMWMAYGEEYDVGKRRDKEAKERIKREAQVGRDWEEGRWAGRTGEWRRRRWVRIVRRVGLGGNGDEGTKS